jgi:hypothetical protein
MFRSKQLIREAIQKNDFLRQLDKEQTIEMVECMYECKVRAGEYVIKEGESGDRLFVSAGEGVRAHTHTHAQCRGGTASVKE